MNTVVGHRDIVLMTLDTLRYDAACEALARGATPNLAALLPDGRWEERHSPGSFTWASHWSFFAGFLPTPARPGRHPRLFAARFPGSETTAPGTCVLDAPDIVTGLAEKGYHTVCIGGVGFFNKQTPVGSTLPALFAESHWSPELGVTAPDSTERQLRLAARILAERPASERIFLFINVSALHQPNRFYLEGAEEDSLESHLAALAYVDGQLPLLVSALRRRGGAFCILCSDHGTAYGEDGFTGHRLAHPTVWTVPYAHLTLEPTEAHP
ncbi:MAG: metalloenzyme domain-containing protein [Myxococcales bacterium]|nr:metalloenzyme domain-containing protein [Myxococcales bacterium]